MSSPSKFLSICFCLALASCGSEEPSSSASPSSTANEIVANQSPGATAATPELGSFGVDLTSRDLSVKPGDDFFRYANGHWLDTFELPADRSTYASFNKLRDRADERVRSIIDDLTSAEPTQGS